MWVSEFVFWKWLHKMEEFSLRPWDRCPHKMEEQFQGLARFQTACCKIPVKKMNNSFSASVWPRHTRLPTPNGITWSSLTNFPSELMNLSGLKRLGFSKWSASLRTWNKLGKIVVPLGIVKPPSWTSSSAWWGYDIKPKLADRRLSSRTALT